MKKNKISKNWINKQRRDTFVRQSKVDVVMSDMAVNTTGIKNIDSIQTGELCIEAMLFSKNLLKGNGFFISFFVEQKILFLLQNLKLNVEE